MQLVGGAEGATVSCAGQSVTGSVAVSCAGQSVSGSVAQGEVATDPARSFSPVSYSQVCERIHA